MSLRGSLGLVVLMCAPLFGGGAWLSFADVQAVGPSSASDVITTVKLIRGDGKTLDTVEITGTAEGLVDGQRVSIPLVIEKLSTPGVLGVRWQRRGVGQWVLAFNVYNGGPGASAVVKVQPTGVKQQLVLLNLGLRWKSALIEAAFTGTVPSDAAVLPPGAWHTPQ